MLAAGQMYVPGHAKSGPYIDKIVYDVLTQEDQRIIAAVKYFLIALFKFLTS
jgi:hypothetical protein